jgi:hypothetical protein
MREPKLSSRGIAHIQNPLRRRDELGVTDRSEPPSPYTPEWHQQREDNDRLYRQLKTERRIEAYDRADARRREQRRRRRV